MVSMNYKTTFILLAGPHTPLPPGSYRAERERWRTLGPSPMGTNAPGTGWGYNGNMIKGYNKRG